LTMRILYQIHRLFTDSLEKKIHPLVCIILTVILSPIILLSSFHLLVLILIVLSTVLVSLLRSRVFLSIIIVAILIILPYIFSVLVVQLIIGYQYLDVVIVNSLRIICLVFLSAIIVFLIDEVRLVFFLSRFSTRLALLTILVVKIVQILLINLDELQLVYDKNLSCGKICRLTGLLRALTYSSIMDSLSIVEAFYTRKHLLLPRRYK